VSTLWEPVDVATLLKGDLQPLTPTLYTRVDGQALLYARMIHSFVGPSESLKTWAALLACAQEIQGGRHVFYFDYEDIPESVLLRLRALGVTDSELIEYLHYYNPETRALVQFMQRMLDDVLAFSPPLCVIDGVTEAMTIEGSEIADNTAIARWLEALPRRLRGLGCAVVSIDHTPHSNHGRAIGGQHKRAGIDVLYTFDNTFPLAQAGEYPITGVSRIAVSKDRPGGVRAYAVDKIVGVLHITAHQDQTVFARVLPPEGGDHDLKLLRAVSDALKDEPLSGRQVRLKVGGRATDVDQALRTLVAEGYVTREEGPQRAQIHTLLTPFTGVFRPAFDPFTFDED
jgi:hypothetical protein